VGGAANSTFVERQDVRDTTLGVAQCRIRALMRLPARATIEVEGLGPGSSLLLFNQTWDPGWRASLDGTPLRVLRRDFSLIGASIPAGRHRLEFVYTDTSVLAGLAVSLAGLLGIAWLLASAHAQSARARLLLTQEPGPAASTACVEADRGAPPTAA
jgi:hypothetical protein